MCYSRIVSCLPPRIERILRRRFNTHDLESEICLRRTTTAVMIATTTKDGYRQGIKSICVCVYVCVRWIKNSTTTTNDMIRLFFLTIFCCCCCFSLSFLLLISLKKKIIKKKSFCCCLSFYVLQLLLFDYIKEKLN